MRYIRLLLSWFLSAFLLLALPLTAYAGTASGSTASRSDAAPVASGSDALPMDDFIESDWFDTVLSGGPIDTVPGVANTVDRTGVYLVMGYATTSGGHREVSVACDASGHVSIPRPADYASPVFLGVRVTKKALPPSGKYEIYLRFGTNTGITISGNKPDFNIIASISNAQTDQAVTREGDFRYSYVGDFYYSCLLDYTSAVFMQLNVPVSSISFNISADISVAFKKSTASVTPNVNQGSNQTPEQVQGGIADNTAQQVEQGNTIIELIKNTIQTISSQLTAFWNQLAGEFTNLYNKLNQHHSEDLAKVDEQISADRQNTDDLISNQDKNTGTITGGYDSSGLDQSSNALNDKLTEYDKIESGIHDSASGWISDFTLPDFDNLLSSGGILAACVWVGSFWQDMFTNMGPFNIPVTLSLSLIFVLMLIGYHRFRR